MFPRPGYHGDLDRLKRIHFCGKAVELQLVLNSTMNSMDLINCVRGSPQSLWPYCPIQTEQTRNIYHMANAF